jgi:hypothetical protein
MDGRNEISAHHWIWALAIFVIAALLGVVWEFSNVTQAIGSVAVVDRKLTDDIAALRQEVASQRETIEALKASAAKSVSATPASVPVEAVAPGPRDAQPKAKPRR